MNEPSVNLDDALALAALADGIIPADERDAGAASVHAGPIIAERIGDFLPGLHRKAVATQTSIKLKGRQHDRGRILQKAASLIEKHGEELAQLITIENGKPIGEAKREVATAESNSSSASSTTCA